MRLVIDASVALKWLLADAPDEADVEMALALLGDIEKGQHHLLQPPHWVTEVLAVIARRAPERLDDSLALLRRLKFDLISDDTTYLRGGRLAARLRQHLFDSLYHAGALEQGATLITADERYFTAAVAEGSILRLRDFKITPERDQS